MIYSNGSTHSLVEVSPAGVFVSGTAGFGSNAFVSPEGVAIDANNNVFVTDVYPNTIVKFGPNGNVIATFSPASIRAPVGIAIDTDNTLWVANSAGKFVSHVTAAGAEATGSPFATMDYGAGTIVLNAFGNWSQEYGTSTTGYIAHYANSNPSVGEISEPVAGNATSVALDSFGNAWYSTSASTGGTVGRLSGNGISNLTPVPVASPLVPTNVFVDGLNQVWVSAYNRTTQSAPGALLKYSNAGALLSPPNGFSANGAMPPAPGFPEGIAIDSSGNLWMSGKVTDNTGADQPNAFVTELIGIAAPVVTPIAVAAKTGTLGMRP